MNVPLVEDAVVDTQHVHVGFDIFQCNNSRFLHHVTQVTCQREFRTLAFRQRGLDEQYLATHTGPRQSCHDASIAVALINVAIEGGLAQQVFNLRRRNLFVGQFTGFSLFEGQFAQGFVHLFLQLAHTALACILLYNLLNGWLVEGQLLVVQTRILLLLGNQVALGNLVLLFRDIAAHLNHLHTVQQRTGDSSQIVGSRNKHHLRQVVVHVQIVVVEGTVLLWVKHFEQG